MIILHLQSSPLQSLLFLLFIATPIPTVLAFTSFHRHLHSHHLSHDQRLQHPITTSSSSLNGWLSDAFGKDDSENDDDDNDDYDNDDFYPSFQLLREEGESSPALLRRESTNNVINLGKIIGSGSYGIVRLCTIPYNPSSSPSTAGEYTYVAKRAWTKRELVKLDEKRAAKKKEAMSMTGNDDIEDIDTVNKNNDNNNDNDNKKKSNNLKERAERCANYLEVEGHCLAKIRSGRSSTTAGGKGRGGEDYSSSIDMSLSVLSAVVPNLIGRFLDDGSFALSSDDDNNNDNSEKGGKRSWLVFDGISDSASSNEDVLPFEPARTLRQLMEDEIDRKIRNDGHDNNNDEEDDRYRLQSISEGMGLLLPKDHRENNDDDADVSSNVEDNDDVDAAWGKTLDVILDGLLDTISTVHRFGIVHRDVKPENILVVPSSLSSSSLSNANAKITPCRLVLIDFGSAADLEPISSISDFTGIRKKQRNGGGGLFNPLSALDNMLAGKEGGEDGLERIGLGNGSRVAVSPVYSAPETFVDLERSPLNFDSFSTALIFFQLLFNLLDERTDAALRRQLEEASWDIDSWLQRFMRSTLRPAGLDGALRYLAERPGLWSLLRDMLKGKPQRRESVINAKSRLDEIMRRCLRSQSSVPGAVSDERGKDAKPWGVVVSDGPFFDSIVASMEICDVPDIDDYDSDGVIGDTYFNDDNMIVDGGSEGIGISVDEIKRQQRLPPRPLHFVATFDRSKPLGLTLSEVGEEDKDSREEKNVEEDKKVETFSSSLLSLPFSSPLSKWERAKALSSCPEDLLVRDIPEGGQADRMRIFEIGDRVRGVGDIPLAGGGFTSFVDMLDSLPSSSKTARVLFDRRPTPSNSAITTSKLRALEERKFVPLPSRIAGQGAWSTKGKRMAQEDAFVLHEIYDRKKNDRVLMAGIFDGHGGNAASKTLSQVLPSLLTSELASLSSLENDNSAVDQSYLGKALTTAWDSACDTYRDGCSLYGECVADYDPQEGIVMAGTGSVDLVAGTTASVAILSTSSSTPPSGIITSTILNCGDSRTLLVGWPKEVENVNDSENGKLGDKSGVTSVVHFSTRDHWPGDSLERDRLCKGRDAGLDYSIPQCSVSRWYVKIGDYQYALSRSLEGNFATSKGITSQADVKELSVNDMLVERTSGMMIIASDGLFEVMDNEQVGKEALLWRDAGLNAEETAKNLCSLALEKKTSDNVSTVVVYFE